MKSLFSLVIVVMAASLFACSSAPQEGEQQDEEATENSSEAVTACRTMGQSCGTFRGVNYGTCCTGTYSLCVSTNYYMVGHCSSM